MKRSAKLLRFIIPSLFGILFFIVPLPYGRIIPVEGMAPVNIGIGALADLFKILLKEHLMMISLVVICSSALLSVLALFVNYGWDFLNKLFRVSPFWLVCRVLGALFTAMVVLGFGPEFIISADSGQTMIELIPSLLAIFFFTGYLLPLIVDFGFMDFVGTLISKYMYRLFRVPGRAAIDAISSWLGDGTLGVMITEAQYKGGYYTSREAAIIAVCFSLVSLPFSTVIAENLGLMSMFVPFYATVCLSSFVCALLVARIYPINRIPQDETFQGVPLKCEQRKDSGALLSRAIVRAVSRAQRAPSFRAIVVEGFKFTLDLYMALLPLCMAWGTLALIISNYTPVFEYLSIPFEYIFTLCGVPDAQEAAPAAMIGFTDMFIPSIMVSGDEIAPITKFIIGALSVSQLIYLTETGAVILKSSIPLNFKDLFVVFMIRTAISLPIIIVVAKLLF